MILTNLTNGLSIRGFNEAGLGGDLMRIGLSGTVHGAIDMLNASGNFIFWNDTEGEPATDSGDLMQIAGNLNLVNAGDTLKIAEGANGRVGQIALAAGTVAIAIASVTDNSRAFVQLVTPSGGSLTVQYQAVCTAGTLTISANIAAGTINAADTSTLNYFVIN